MATGPLGRGASANLLAGDRLYLQQGPINLIIKAYGSDDGVREAYEQACATFGGLLEGLVEELVPLRQPVTESPPSLRSTTGQRMVDAATGYREHWVTPMAAVAGAVAEEVAQAMSQVDGLSKLFVNNSGDIALWLTPGETLDIGIVASLKTALPEANLKLHFDDGIFGIATSGWDGHSFSSGIADAVTVLAASAAAADVAATLIANEVNVKHSGIKRRPASEIDPNSDLGTRLITVEVPELSSQMIEYALERGTGLASELVQQGRIKAVLLALQGGWRSVGQIPSFER